MFLVITLVQTVIAPGKNSVTAEWEVRQIIVQCEVRISVLSVMLRNAMYSGARA